MHPVVLQEEFLLGVLIELISHPPMLSVHIISKSIKLLPDRPQAVVKFGLDDELMVIESVQVYRSLYHFL